MKTLQSIRPRAGLRYFVSTLLATILILPLPNADRASAAGLEQGTDELPSRLIEFGDVVFGSIGAPGETQEYTFVANYADVILIRASRVTGDLWPRLQLSDPGHEPLWDEHSPVHVEFTVKVQRGGTHRIRVSDGFDETGVGTYRFLLQRVNGAAASTPLSFGRRLAGSIVQEAEMDAYTFSAEGGDVILTRVSGDSGDLWPEIRLYDPAGELLNSNHDPSHTEFTTVLPTTYYSFLPMVQGSPGSSAHEEARTALGANYRATVSGTYTVLVGDGFNGTLTGGYGLYVQRLDGPGNAGGLSFGATHSSTIAQTGEMDTYTFAADVRDKVLVGISRVTGDLHSEIRLYDPTGSLINSAKDANYAEATTSLPISGTYTLLVGDGFWGSGTGKYHLYLQRLSNPAGATPLSFGEVASGSIHMSVEMATYTFSASVGDEVLFGASPTSGFIWPEVRLYEPAGNLVDSTSDRVHAQMTVRVSTAGAHTVLIGDGFNGTETGDFNLYVQRINNPGYATPIVFGELVSGGILHAAEMDTYTFAAVAGDQVRMGISRTSGNLWPKITLYDPDGALVDTDSGSASAEITGTLFEGGTYTILCSDGLNGASTGEYDLQLEKVSPP